MTNASLEELGNGRFRVLGALDHETVDQLLKVDEQLFDSNWKEIEVDLSGVTRTTSVGLALMLEWLRQAQLRNTDIRFSHVPAQILGIAKLSQLESILALDDQP